MSDTEKLSLLGQGATKYPQKPEDAILETFANKWPGSNYVVELECPEFTSLCVHGDTLIDVVCDRQKYPQGIPIQELVGTTGYLFTFDQEDHQPKVKKYRDVRKTGICPVVRILLRQRRGHGKTTRYEEKELILTPEHLVLVRSGFSKYSWVRAQDLEPGQHLITNQRYISISGELTDSIRGCCEYQLVQEAILGRSLLETELVHHRDGNHWNHVPSNLEVLTNKEHFSLHQTQRYGYSDTLDVSELIRLYESGLSIDQLSKKFSCDGSTIKARLIGRTYIKSQSEILRSKRSNDELYTEQECQRLYALGYTIYELSEYFDIHSTTVLKWIRKQGGQVRTSLETKQLRASVELATLNHIVISVQQYGIADVYNMEVEDTEAFFANDILVHNCPKTGQPDFAKITIGYIPDKRLVESKALKLYLFSFRNHGEFHEDVTNRIAHDLFAAMEGPKILVVRGDFFPRGGISINPNVVLPNDPDPILLQRVLHMLAWGRPTNV